MARVFRLAFAFHVRLPISDDPLTEKASPPSLGVIQTIETTGWANPRGRHIIQERNQESKNQW